MIPILAAARHRVICPDPVGFGRSDKPTRIEDHTYARQVEWMRALAFDVLDPQRVTLVGQDWGGLIGLRLAAEHPDRFARGQHRAAHRRPADAPDLVESP
jgi:haloalkane dehalogenase